MEQVEQVDKWVVVDKHAPKTLISLVVENK
jgi:hypothetical protein